MSYKNILTIGDSGFVNYDKDIQGKGRLRPSKREKGMHGENVACKYLREKGYYIIERNFRSRFGEIDIVALDRKCVLVFIEVKTRSSNLYGSPATAVTKRKLEHLKTSAKIFILMNKRYTNIKFRFDVIEILLRDGRTYLNHIENISM